MPITAVTPSRPAPGDQPGLMYVRSYLLIRLLIGLLGWSLPVLVVVGALVLGDDDPWKGSLSAYYHSGMRDVFVGALSATALFLLCYMTFERNWDNALSVGAGVGALGAALLPTSGGQTLTPVQELLGETLVAALHFVFAAVFILALAAICHLFGRREAVRPGRSAEQRRRGRRLHWTCAGVVVGAVVFILLGAVLPMPGPIDGRTLFVGETVAVVAFGISWFVKGTELRLLLGRGTDAELRRQAEGVRAA